MLDLKKSQMEFAANLKALRKGEDLSHAKLAEKINERYKGKTLLAEREGKKRKSITSKDSLISYEVADEYHSRKWANLGMSVETLLLFSDFYRVSADYLLGLSKLPLKDDEARAIHYDIGLNAEAITYLRTLREWNADRTTFFEWLSEGARENTGKPLDDEYKQRLLDPRLALLSKLVERIGKKDSDGNYLTNAE
jgi:transcriptional regulator with XRE-family HTH domain